MRLMGQFETIVPNEIGPCEGLDAISYKVLWASLSVLANGGTFMMWANMRSCSAAILVVSNNVGPYSSLVLHLIKLHVHLIGPFQSTIQIKLAHAKACM